MSDALAGCTQKTELPENPKDQEEYRDAQGNSWIYNAMLMRWALMPSLANGLTTTHYYYPKSGSWTDANGTRVHAPEGVKVRTSAASGAKSSGRCSAQRIVRAVCMHKERSMYGESTCCTPFRLSGEN